MKKILVPFNFTEVGKNALIYAIQLFQDDAEFTVFHAIDGNLSIDDPIILSMGLPKEEGLKKEIQDIVDEVFLEYGKKIPYHVGIGVGNVVEAIVKVVKKVNFDAVVMGTRDKYDLFDKLFGTVSMGVVKRLQIPVYLIPLKSQFRPYKKVVVASDWHLESDVILDAIEKWNELYQAELHFLHVGSDEMEDNAFITNIVEEFFEERDVPFSFVVDTRAGKDVVREICNYTDEENADLQMVITDRSSWLDTMTSKSVTKKMVLQTRHPVLFIHSGMIRKSRIFFDYLTYEL